MTLTAQLVPYSSVVGSSITLHDETGQVMAQLSVMGVTPCADDESTAARKARYIQMAERIQRALVIGLAATEQQVFHPGRGSTYDVVAAEALFQVSNSPIHNERKVRSIEDGDKVTVYRNEHGTFVRFPDEMVSPRFEPVP